MDALAAAALGRREPAARNFSTLVRPFCAPWTFASEYGAPHMNLHEYQSKKLFAATDLRFRAASSRRRPKSCGSCGGELGGSVWVVKAQVHAGGRGKAGGVKLARDFDAVRAAAAGMLGTNLVTHQTGPEGLPVHQVYVEEGSDIAREIYLSLVLNRETSRIAFIASAAGGMDIEEVAEHTPEKIITRQRSSGGGTAGLPMPASSRSAWGSPAGRSANSARSRERCTGCISSAMRASSKSIR